MLSADCCTSNILPTAILCLRACVCVYCIHACLLTLFSVTLCISDAKLSRVHPQPLMYLMKSNALIVFLKFLLSRGFYDCYSLCLTGHQLLRGILHILQTVLKTRSTLCKTALIYIMFVKHQKLLWKTVFFFC